MTITLSPEAQARVQRLMSGTRYPDVDALLDEALSMLEARERERVRELRELVLAGRDSGNYRELTDELVAEIAREADEADRLGLPIRDAVQP